MAKVPTWLSRTGKAIIKVLVSATTLARVFEPEVDLSVPEVAGLYNSTVALATVTEAAFGDGTGADKGATVKRAVLDYAQQNGFVAKDDVAVDKWVSAFADTLNLIPFTKAAAPPPTPAP